MSAWTHTYIHRYTFTKIGKVVKVLYQWNNINSVFLVRINITIVARERERRKGRDRDRERKLDLPELILVNLTFVSKTSLPPYKEIIICLFKIDNSQNERDMQFSPSGLQRHHTSKTVSKTLFPLASRKLFGVATLSDSLQSHRSAVTCLPLSILRHSHRVNETMTIIKQECTRGTTVRPTVSLNLLWMHLNIYRPHEKNL